MAPTRSEGSPRRPIGMLEMILSLTSRSPTTLSLMGVKVKTGAMELIWMFCLAVSTAKVLTIECTPPLVAE